MVKVVTDSCADIPSELAQELGITIVPLNVYFGDDSFQDGVNLSADEFYDRLTKGTVLPKTTAPAPGTFVDTYSKLAAETNEIISIHISKKLSGTYDAASLGKEQLEQTCRIEVIDSLMASMGVGLLAIVAAKAARDNANLDEITALIHKSMPQTRYFGLVDTLEYLHKGGRLGRGQAFLGSLLNVKPILHVHDGEVYPLERVRSYPKALARLAEMAKNVQHIKEMALMYTTVPDDLETLNTQLSPLVAEGHLYNARVGPTIGTYLGPGALTIGLIGEE